MANFPTSLPSFAGFTSSHTLAADNHAAQSNLEQGEIVAVATKIGIGSSTPTSGKLLRANGVGTSSWAQADLTSDVTGVLPQANGGTGTTLATGTGKAVYDTSPTISAPTLTGGGSWTGSPGLTTPIIASFVNSNHDHTNSAGGGTLGTNAINNAAITVPKLQYGMVYRRQGGSATDWSNGGTTTFDSSAVSAFWQVGKITVTSDNFVITFPVAYSGTPIVTATSATASSVNSYPIITAVTASTFTVRVLNAAGALATTEQIHWIAGGPA